MSAVLRKKIKAAGGVPPSVLRMQDFWTRVQERLEQWGGTAFKRLELLSIGSRRAMNGDQIIETLREQIRYSFSAKASGGVVSIAFDNEAAALVGAARMGQSADMLKEGSPLFLRLLLEEGAGQLWRQLADGLAEHDPGFHGDLIVPDELAAGGFETSSQYLLVPVEVQASMRPANIWIVMSLDYLREQARVYARQARMGTSRQEDKVRDVLRQSVRTTHVMLDAVLDRMTMTIAECTRLEVGQTVPLVGVDPGEVILSAKTVNGELQVGVGEMGVWKRNRALKLKSSVPESFVRELAEL